MYHFYYSFIQLWKIGLAFLLYLKVWPISHVLSKWWDTHENISNIERLLKWNISKTNKYDIKCFHITGHVPWLRDAHFPLKFWIDCLVSQNDIPLHLILWQYPKDKFRDTAFSFTTNAATKKNSNTLWRTHCAPGVVMWISRWGQQFRSQW